MSRIPRVYLYAGIAVIFILGIGAILVTRTNPIGYLLTAVALGTAAVTVLRTPEPSNAELVQAEPDTQQPVAEPVAVTPPPPASPASPADEVVYPTWESVYHRPPPHTGRIFAWTLAYVLLAFGITTVWVVPQVGLWLGIAPGVALFILGLMFTSKQKDDRLVNRP